MKSLLAKIEENKPLVIALVETHLCSEDTIDIEGYTVMRNDRNSYGGGILIAVREVIHNITMEIEKKDGDYESIWIQLDNGVTNLRMGVVYLPQENTPKAKLIRIYKSISECVNENTIIMGDFNAKIGRGDDLEAQSAAGKIMENFIKHNELKVINHAIGTKGRWTRVQAATKSEIDYVIATCSVSANISKLVIDEEKLDSLFHVKDEMCVYPDHNAMISEVYWGGIVKDMKGKGSHVGITKEGYIKIANEIEKKKLHEKIDMQGDIDEEYEKFTSEMMKIVKKNQKKQKNCTPWKACRKISAQIKDLKRVLRANTVLKKEENNFLKNRIYLLKQEINDFQVEKNQKQIQLVLKKIGATGRADMRAFWDFHRQGKDNVVRSAIIDENGIRHEDEKAIKEVYSKYYADLLTTRGPENEEERRAQNRVDEAISRLELVWSLTNNEKGYSWEELTGYVENAVKELKKRKATDQMGWKNEYIVVGGAVLKEVLSKLFSMMYAQKRTPKQWEYIKIKSIPKAGSKLITKRRGLFITSVIGKVLEKVIKLKTEEEGNINMSPFQSGGVKGRSIIDNTFAMLAIINRNKYLQRPTYCVFVDLTKCFDKLWLEDCILELERSGMHSKDTQLIYEMNRNANIVIDTPVGKTEHISIKNTVKQGTIYAVIMCGLTTSRVNSLNERVVYSYGPNVEIESLVYLDDMSNTGSYENAEKFVGNCSQLEKTKKAIVNTDKSGYVIVDGGESPKELQTEVKEGKLKREREMQSLGCWIDERGTYQINIEKKKGDIEGLIKKVENMAAETKVGRMAIALKLELVERVICPSIHVSIQAWHGFTEQEMLDLESRQLSIIKRLLKLPRCTPGKGILFETGIWPVKDKIAYKKLMLYHNIIHSDETRIMKKIVNEQERTAESGSWFDNLRKESLTYGMTIQQNTVTGIKKQAFKKYVKSQIQEEIERKMKNEPTTKLRTVFKNSFGRKPYLEGELTSAEVTKIMNIKLHMIKANSNYGKNELCEFCKTETETTEHLILGCTELEYVREERMPSLETNNVDEIKKLIRVMDRIDKVKIDF